MRSRFRWFRVGLLALLIVALAGCSTPPPRLADGWQTVAPENAGFSVDLPGKPKLVKQYDTNEVNYIWAYVGDQRQILVMVGVSDYYYPPFGIPEELRRDEVNFIKGMHGKSLFSRRTQTRGADGKMLPSSLFTFETASGWTGEARVIVDGQTVYMTTVMWPRSSDGSAALKRIMASYKLLPRTRPPEPEGAKK